MVNCIKRFVGFSLFFLIFIGLTGCTGGKITIYIPMEIKDLIGIWEGELTLGERDEEFYESVMEITQASETCWATISIVQATERDAEGFTDILLSGSVIQNKLHLSNMDHTNPITYEATYMFTNKEKTIMTGTISRFSSETSSNRIIVDSWQGDFHKWLDPDKQPINFEDNALERAVREAEGFTGQATGSIYPKDLTGIREITLENQGVHSLEGLQHLINLQKLYANNNEITDLRPLQGLTELKLLYLSANPINDLSPLENLVKLEALRFYETQVADLTPLHQLTQLKTLDFADSQVDDLSGIQTLENLTYLNCGYNLLSDLSALQYLINLQSIWLINNQIEDITPLIENSGLGMGDYLDIRNNLLDLTPESDDMQNIQNLINRGVIVFYEIQ